MIVTICNTEMVQNSSDYSGKEDFYDEWAMYKYQFMENGLKLKLVFVDSKEEIITPLPTEVYQKIK